MSAGRRERLVSKKSECVRWPSVHEMSPVGCATEPDWVPGRANGLGRTGTAPAVNPAASNSAAFDAFDTVLECTPTSDSTMLPRWTEDTD